MAYNHVVQITSLAEGGEKFQPNQMDFILTYMGFIFLLPSFVFLMALPAGQRFRLGLGAYLYG